jgi:hypothetical protein
LLAILVQPIENMRLETLQNHVVGVLDLLVHAGVSHGCPIDMDVVLIAELEEFFPMNCVPLSVMMELGTPNRWIISVKNATTSCDLILEIGLASIHLVNLSTATRT